MKTTTMLWVGDKAEVEEMTLGDKQRLFSMLLAELVLWAYDEGYEITYGDFYRDPRVHGQVGSKQSYSSSASCHKSRLAGDLNLFKDGKYLTSTEDHRPLGEKWESMNELCRWGGHFNDGNHYSFEHNGRM